MDIRVKPGFHWLKPSKPGAFTLTLCCSRAHLGFEKRTKQPNDALAEQLSIQQVQL